jgi:hypothetical protein
MTTRGADIRYAGLCQKCKTPLYREGNSLYAAGKSKCNHVLSSPKDGKLIGRFFRLSPAEDKHLYDTAKELGIGKSEYIRALLRSDLKKMMERESEKICAMCKGRGVL